MILTATWDDGLFAFQNGGRTHEHPAHSVRSLAPDGHGGALAIVDGHTLCRRAQDGVWTTIAATDKELSCCLAVGGIIYAGTDEAQVLRLGTTGAFEQLTGFEQTAGRDKWYAGGAVINGQFMGPPLGVRSLAANTGGTVLLANVHVGGIPRSLDGGETWSPTLDINSDVHEVRVHPARPQLVAAASAIGLCTSSDAGAAWQIEKHGLHALHCSAVAFTGDDIFVSAAESPFASEGAVYRRAIDDLTPLTRITGHGLPEWLQGSPDTNCISTLRQQVAFADRKGNLYYSADNGRTWSNQAVNLPMPSSVLLF